MGVLYHLQKRHTISNVLLMKVNNTSKPVEGLLPVHSMNVRVPDFKRVNLTRSTNRVTKQVTYFECLTDYCSTIKQKFSKKGKGEDPQNPPREERYNEPYEPKESKVEGREN